LHLLHKIGGSGGRWQTRCCTEAAVDVDAVAVVGAVTVFGEVTVAWAVTVAGAVTAVVGAVVTVTTATLVTGVLPLKLALESTAMEKKQQNN